MLLTYAPLTRDQIHFMVDRVKTRSGLRDALFTLIEGSKTDASIAIASANAATILNACHINLSYQNWQNVQLPGADFRYALLAHSDLSNANLHGATLMSSVLYQTRLVGADLRDVQWGEWPYLQLKSIYELRFYFYQEQPEVIVKPNKAVAYHPHEPWLAVAQGKDILVLHSETGETMGKPFEGHSSLTHVVSVAFSPDGRYLGSGNSDGTVRLWDVAKRKP